MRRHAWPATAPERNPQLRRDLCGTVMRMSVNDGTLSDALTTYITGSGSLTHLRLLAVESMFGLSTAASASTFTYISAAVLETVGLLSDGTSGAHGWFR